MTGIIIIMIYVLKKNDLYVAAAIGQLETVGNIIRRKPNTKVRFQMTKDINKARLIEDPDMDAVKKYGLTAHIVHADKPQIKEIGICLN